MIDWNQVVTAEDKARQQKDAVLDAIAGRRWQAECSGIAVDGMAFKTDRESQALITGAALSAMLDSNYSVQWKTPEGFVLITGQQVIAVATAIRAHVQACFDREAELVAAVEAGTYSTEMLDSGWPE